MLTASNQGIVMRVGRGMKESYECRDTAENLLLVVDEEAGSDLSWRLASIKFGPGRSTWLEDITAHFNGRATVQYLVYTKDQIPAYPACRL